MDMLNIRENVLFDNSITNIEYHSYQSYSGGELKHNDECRIIIQQQDLLTVPSESYLQIQGKLTKDGNTAVSDKVKLTNNFVAFLFEELRYELGGVIVDRVKNPGITTSMKGYVSFTPNESVALANASWTNFNNFNYDKNTGYFDICWPLSMIFGFAEDYKKVLLNLRQELVLIRSSEDLNCICESTGVEKGKIQLLKIVWRMPHLTVSDYEKIKLLDIIEKNVPIPITHRRWEMFSYPMLQESHIFTWILKASTFLEKPRFVIFGLQTDRRHNLRKQASHFDHNNLKNIKLYLNSQAYPYENLSLDFRKSQFALAYDMYTKFQRSYYFDRKSICEPLLSKEQFRDLAPLIVIDCSYQNEMIKQGAIDARLEFETEGDIPPNTAAYCLVLHEQFISYEPLTGRVRIL